MAMTRADKLVAKTLVCVILLSAAVAWLTSCSPASNDIQTPPEPTTVTLTFSPYRMEAMTRAATSIADVVTRLDVWLLCDGSEAAAVHQSASDAGFGSIAVTLDRTQTYTLCAVAHRATAAATLSDGVIAWPDDKVTQTLYYQTTFSPADGTSLSCEMHRIVGVFRLEIADDIPDGLASLRFSIPQTATRYSLTDGNTHLVDRTQTVSYGGTSANFNLYLLSTADDATLFDITVAALASDGSEIQTRRFASVPIRNGYKTTFRGEFFTNTATTAAFTVEQDWQEYDVTTF